MLEIGRINCFSHGAVPKNWKYNRFKGINRLYHIESDGGAYLKNGVKLPFKKGYIYFFPYTAEYNPVCSECEGMLHTYADFEMIPPVIYPSVIELPPPQEPIAKAALDVFCAGGRYYKNRGMSGADGIVPLSDEKKRLCRSAIAFLAGEAARSVGASVIADSVVIRALEIMNAEMSRKISVSSIAAECFMTTDSFIRRFTRVIGTTPYAYLKGLRVRSALYLRSSGKSLEEIAAETGYSDASSLLHALNKYHEGNLGSF